MLINGIFLGNYRNYKNLELKFNPHLNILVGPNAQGKTNILEAMFYCATGKSHRTNYDQDLIHWGEKFFRLTVAGERASGPVKIEIMARADGKKVIKVNNNYCKKVSDLIGVLNVVLFSPEDMLLVKGGPSVRRRFLDIEISQTSPFYCHNLVNYNKVLAQRNNLLKAVRDQQADSDLLDVWDLQLAEFGAHIIRKRDEVLKKIYPIAAAIHDTLTGGTEELKISYLPSVNIPESEKEGSLEDYFLAKLRDNRNSEIAKGVTTIGPHRDDIEIKIGDTNIRSFGSQGQQRTCALSMKLAEVEFMKQETGEYPILLLDDVMSELDGSRRKFLLDVVDGKVQTFVTTTGVEEIFVPVKNRSRIFKVIDGKISVTKEGS